MQQGPSLKLTYRPTKPTHNPLLTTAILPDMQIGYYTDRRGTYHPTHDESAIDVALQLIDLEPPDQIILLGDILDLPDFGTYRKYESIRNTTQKSIDRTTVLFGQLRSIAKDKPIYWIEGNHEARYNKFLADNADVLVGLRPGDSPDASYPVNSLPVLCRLDELGITYRGGWPGGQVKINNNLLCFHGNMVRKWSTATAYLQQAERVSCIFGHTHRYEIAMYTRADADGVPKTVMAASPGTLSRIDGSVPSTNSGYDFDGCIVTGTLTVPNWQQGIAYVYSEPGDGRFSYVPTLITNGHAIKGQVGVGSRVEMEEMVV